MVTGCSHEPSRPPPDEIQSELDRFGAGASYQPVGLTKGTEVIEQWKNGSRTLDILYTAPEEPGRYPLVVYLPGLGQDAGSAPLWRDAWVKGGFAVLVGKVLGSVFFEVEVSLGQEERYAGIPAVNFGELSHELPWFV